MTNKTVLKKIFLLTTLLLICFFIIAIQEVEAYEPPIGIPDPNWLVHPINTPNPVFPSEWPLTVAIGNYYVDSDSVVATDVNNEYGYPGRPRATMPVTELRAGSKIFVKHCSSLTAFNNVSGTAEKPNWIIGVNGGVIQPEIAGRYLEFAYSNYWIIDGLTFDGTNTPNDTSSGAFKVDGGSNYISFRNSKIQDMVVGDFSETRKVAAWFGSLTSVLPSLTNHADISNIVFYNLNIANNSGGQFLDYESGRHAILSAAYIYNNVAYSVDSFWILNSTLHNNPEDGIQIGLSAFGSDQTKCKNIYIGGNTITNNGENAIDLKASSNIIISGNTFSGSIPTVYRPGATSGSDGSVGVINDDGGGPIDDWWIFNNFSNSRCGIRNQSSGGSHYIIGNLFYDLNKRPEEDEPNSAGKNGGVAYWQSAGNASTHLINNTIHDVYGGMYLNNVKNLYVKGNIVSDIVNQTIGFPITINNSQYSELISNIYYDKDGAVRRDNDSIGANDKVDINPLFVDENSKNYQLQNLSIGVELLTRPDEYNLFDIIFSRNISFDINRNTRSATSNISAGAFEFINDVDTVAPNFPIGVNVI